MITYMIEYFRLHRTHRTEHHFLVEISLLDELVNCCYLRAMTVIAELSYVTFMIQVFRVISHLIQSLCAYLNLSLIFQYCVHQYREDSSLSSIAKVEKKS